LHEKTGKQLEALFGVTRQAIDIWRAKGGDDLLRRSDALVDEADARLLPLLNTDKSATELALETGESVYTLRLVAKRNGIRLRNGVAKKPTDEEIIRLAEGRTWRELATVCHITLPTLRNYVYARPTLSAQVCARITRQTNGPASHGKVDPEEILRLHTQGLSRYAIAERLGVEQMTITHWLKKLDVRRGDS
jgi:transcriptional regulator with XRE-family HTH domain